MNICGIIHPITLLKLHEFTFIKQPTYMKKIQLLLALLVFTFTLHAQIYNYTTATNGSFASVAAHTTGSGLIRVNGATVSTSPCSSGFTSRHYSDAIGYSPSGAAIEFSVTPDSAYQLNVISFAIKARRSSTGPASLKLAYSIDNGSTWSISVNATITPFNGSCTQIFQGGTWYIGVTGVGFSSSTAVKFRIYGYNAASINGDLTLANIVIDGTVTRIDFDGDGYANDVDCNDSNALVYPGSVEQCNGIDDDCSGITDDYLPHLKWSHPYGGVKDWGPSFDKLKTLTPLPDGTMIAAGTTSYEDIDEYDYYDYWITNIDTDGAVIRDKKFGGSAEEGLSDFQLTPDGGAILFGFSYSTDGDLTANNGSSDYWVVKVDASWSIQWQKNLGGSLAEIAGKLLQTTDGGYLLSGTSTSSNADVSGNYGSSDIWMVKLDVNGNIMWQHNFGGSGNENSVRVSEIASGGYFIGCLSSSSDHDATGNHGGNDYLIVKIDANGNKIWSKMLGSTGSDKSLAALINTSDGGCIAGGTIVAGSGNVTAYHGGSSDEWIFKLDASGNLEWQRALGGSNLDEMDDLKIGTDGKFLVFGNTKSSDGDVTGFSGTRDAWLVKVNITGNIEWNKAFGAYNAVLGSLITREDGNCVVFWGVDGFYDSFNAAEVSPAGIQKWSLEIETCINNGFYCYYLASDLLLAKSGNSNYFLGCTVIDYGGVGGDDFFISKISLDPFIFYADSDHDGYGDPNDSIAGCSASFGYTYNKLDCDDANAAVNPNATETCNSLDDNCNGQIDEGLALILFPDNDGDGFGNPNAKTLSCTPLSGYVSDSTDCNDNNVLIHPGSNDLCNAVDDNCNGVIDENSITAITTPVGSVSTCSGTVIVVTANTGFGITYQWKKGNTNIAGATNSTYATSKAGSYKVVENNIFSCTSTSAVTTLSITALPQATITPLGNLNICSTGSVTLQANAGSGLLYQWVKGANNISGATSQNYTATTKATYKVIVTSGNGCSKTSTGAKVINSCKEINGESISDAFFTVFPNPASTQFTVSFSDNEINDAMMMQVTNVLGQIVMYRAVADGDEAIVKVNIPGTWANGVYFVKIINAGTNGTARLVINR